MRKAGWILFLILLLIQVYSMILRITPGFKFGTVPFKLNQGRIEELEEDSLAAFLENKIILQIDSTTFYNPEKQNKDSKIEESSSSSNIVIMRTNDREIIHVEMPEIMVKGDSVELVCQDTLSGAVSTHTIPVKKIWDYQAIGNFLINFLLVTIIYFNAFLLLRYSRVRENILIVYFLLFLFTPGMSDVLPKFLHSGWENIISPFWGILFYHYICIKTGVSRRIRKIYLQTLIIGVISFLINIWIGGVNLVTIWSLIWLIKAFLLLRRSYKSDSTGYLKRLMAAFGGLVVSLLSIMIFLSVILLLIIVLGVSSLAGFSSLVETLFESYGIIIAVIILLPTLGVILGIIWFLASFTWSLLDGTTLDVKIRSSLIYTIIGIFFVSFFGLIDYSLGELLQNIFGKFIGTEFIAGIPATIGLLILFNPVKNKVERLVDSRLNTTELDFLEKTESFTRELSEEGVLEGFEGYICDNLIRLLMVKKVALIVMMADNREYIVKEIRGSELEENSLISDEKGILQENNIIRLNNFRNMNEADAASFSLIIPIIFEDDLRWFLALGEKNDGSTYTRKDEEALVKLVERIGLSLKFILSYEEIMAKKYQQKIAEKDKKLKQKDTLIRQLKDELKKA